MAISVKSAEAQLTLDVAQAVVEAARQRADEIGVPMSIAVVDEGNNLVAFAHMDGARLGSIGIAQYKAYTARAFDMASKELAPLARPGARLYSIEASNQGRRIGFIGGIPLQLGGRIVGAIGVSGGSVQDEHDVAQGGVAALWRRAEGARAS